MARKAPPAKASKVETTTPDDGKRRVRIGGGGPWKGTLWLPQGASKKAAEKAEEYGNAIIEEEMVAGPVFSGKAFNKKDVFYIKHKKHGDLLMPQHGGLESDLDTVISKYGEGAEVEVTYTGTAELQGGDFKGNLCQTYDVAVIL